MCKHVWREDETSLRCFVGCVSPHNCDPRAHGAVTYTEYCTRCGATRPVNKNRGFKEVA